MLHTLGAPLCLSCSFKKKTSHVSGAMKPPCLYKPVTFDIDPRLSHDHKANLRLQAVLRPMTFSKPAIQISFSSTCESKTESKFMSMYRGEHIFNQEFLGERRNDISPGFP